MLISITLQHEKRRSDVEVDTTEDVVRIMEAAWDVFSVPVAKQRIVFKGKTLSPDMRIESLNLITGSRMLVLGEAMAQSNDSSAIFKPHADNYEKLVDRLKNAETNQHIRAVAEVRFLFLV